MKTTLTWKEFCALPTRASQAADETVWAKLNPPLELTPESVQGYHFPPEKIDESFRELHEQRYIAPFPRVPPSPEWEINWN